MCVLYELTVQVKKQFFSLNNLCILILEKTKHYMEEYVNQTDDLILLSDLLLEKDLSGKDSLQLIKDNELLEIL